MVASAGGRPDRISVVNGRRRPTAQSKVTRRVATPELVLGPERFPVERPICAMAEDIRAVRQRGHIYILCGEAHPDVYNSCEVREAIVFAREQREATIVVVTGPILLAPEGDVEHNGLISLFEQGYISKLYHRRRRFATNHFRVVDGEPFRRYYSECAHPPLLDVSKRTCENFHRFSNSHVEALAAEAVHDFKFWKDQSLPHKTAAKQGLPLITTPTRLGWLMDRAWSLRRAIEYLDADELLELQPDNEEWLTPIRAYRERLKARTPVSI